MDMVENKVVLNDVLPSVHRAGRFGYKEYRLNIKNLTVNNAAMEFRPRQSNLELAGVNRSHLAIIRWDRFIDKVSHNFCTQLVQEVGALIPEATVRPLVTEEKILLGNITIIGYEFIQPLCTAPERDGGVFGGCTVEICFPSISVMQSKIIEINAVVKDYTLGKAY